MRTPVSLGDRILSCRLLLGIAGASVGRTTQTDLALAVTDALQGMKSDAPPLSKVTISRWELGKTEPCLATISAIAEVFGCEASWLAFGTGTNPLDSAR
jgi:transcriptional regulator with XRE-family HTH domain